jgi:hypothetical protein
MARVRSSADYWLGYKLALRDVVDEVRDEDTLDTLADRLARMIVVTDVKLRRAREREKEKTR